MVSVSIDPLWVAPAEVYWGLAKNPAVGEDLLRSLLRSDDVQTQRALASRPDLSDDLVEALARHSQAAVRGALARNFTAAMRVWRLLAADPPTCARLASDYTGHTPRPGTAIDRPSDPPLPDEVGRALAASADLRVRQALAHRKHNTEEVWRMLATDPDRGVRRALAKRWKTAPQEVVREWLTDPEVRLDAVFHHVPPADLVPVLLADDHPSIRAGVAVNAHLDRPTAVACAGSPDRDIRDAVARNVKAPLDAVLPLANDPDLGVRAALMFRPDLPEPVREQISRAVPPPLEYRVADWLLPGAASLETRLAHLDSPVPFIRRAVAHSTDLPPAAVARLLDDPDPSVRQVMAEHYPHTSADLLVALAERSHQAKLTVSLHPNFPARAIVRYASATDEFDRVVAAAHPRIPDNAAARLVHDRSNHVRQSLAANPAVAPERLVALLSDTDRYVAMHAAGNPALPLSVADALIRAAAAQRRTR